MSKGSIVLIWYSLVCKSVHCPFKRQTASMEIVRWDDPLSDEGAWIVLAESEAQAPFA